MQIKKEDVRNRILTSALAVFGEVGFEKASLRRIVKEAGTTLGNFYNYFDSKESLFDALVRDSYEGFMAFLEHHEDEVDVDRSRPLTAEVLALGMTALRIQVEQLLGILTPEFLLLVEGSQGTSYEGFREQVAAFFAGHYLEHITENGQEDCVGYSDVAGGMFVDGLTALVKKLDEDKLVQGLMQHFLFFSLGTAGVISMSRDLKGGELDD